MRQVLEQEWGEDLIVSWNKAGWFDPAPRLGDRLAPLIGARAGEVAVTDTTSVNLFKALAAARRSRRRRGAAPSSPSAATSRPISIWRRAWPPGSTAAGACAWWTARTTWRRRSTPTAPCVMLTHVNYRTGYQHDMAYVTRSRTRPAR
jgi:kynureninase